MKAKISAQTVQNLIELLSRFDSSTEQFLDDLPTPQKYAILAMAQVVRGDYEDFEIAYYESMEIVTAQNLTAYLMSLPSLQYHLQDALRLKLSFFEVGWTDSEDDEV